MTMGQRALPWRYMREYVSALKGLLAGESVAWDGGLIRMMHPDGFGAARPVSVPLLLGIGGPRGYAAARDLADGVFVTAPRPSEAPARAGWRTAVLTFGTVLGAGEDPGAPRVVAAAGHAVAVGLHAMYERDPAALGRVPGGESWLAAIERVPPAQRHIALHDLHLVGVSEIDAPMVTGEAIRARGFARTADGWRDRLSELEAAGATEIAYQPAGPDIPGELERFAAAGRATRWLSAVTSRKLRLSRST
jgi:5,10-methylenetetrahydromethanopterin reductase